MDVSDDASIRKGLRHTANSAICSMSSSITLVFIRMKTSTF
jgi:hypothetical protein